MPLSRTRLESILGAAQAAAEVAAGLISDAARRPLETLEISEKHPADYVTEVDRELEEHFRRCLVPLVPGSAFLGEEGGLEGDPEGLLWVVDPLDGTTNFTRGLKPYGFSVALLEARVPVLGVLGVPSQGWLLAAGTGLGVHGSGRRRPNGSGILGQGTLAGTGLLRGAGVPAWFGPLAETGARLRFFGSTVAHLAGVALGRLDVAIQGFGRIWDVAGGLVVVAEGGGRMARLDGTPLAPFREQELSGAHIGFLAGSPEIVEQVLARIPGKGVFPGTDRG